MDLSKGKSLKKQSIKTIALFPSSKYFIALNTFFHFGAAMIKECLYASVYFYRRNRIKLCNMVKLIYSDLVHCFNFPFVDVHKKSKYIFPSFFSLNEGISSETR